MKLEILLEELDKLNLPADKYAITSSGPMAARGIREANDLDLVVTKELWRELSVKYPTTEKAVCDTINVGNIEILGSFRIPGFFSVEDQIARADIIDGHRFVNLDMIIAFKKGMAREKDRKDIELINEYLAKN